MPGTKTPWNLAVPGGWMPCAHERDGGRMAGRRVWAVQAFCRRQNLGGGGIHFRRAFQISTDTTKKATPIRCGLFYGIRENLKCSAEVNPASAKVLPAAKRLYGANVPPRCAGPRPASASFSSIQNKEKDMTCGHVFLFVSRAIGPSYPPVIPTPGASSLLL